MGLDHLSGTSLVPLIVATIVLTAVLILIARVIWRGIRAIDRWVARHLPRTGATVATVIVVVLIAQWALGAGFGAFENRARGTFRTVDDGTEDGITQPMQPTVSGSPDSLIPWDTLGLQGRTFVARATPEAELKKFPSGRKVLPPIRIYAGLASADDAAARADLAVRDLECGRVGFTPCRARRHHGHRHGLGRPATRRSPSSSSTAATRR